MNLSKITNGTFNVELDLNGLLNKAQLNSFDNAINSIFVHDQHFLDICNLKNGILRYKSETLLPLHNDPSKKKVLLVFGNPAIHSVKHGMFFFSKVDFKRHSMWGKLAKAGLVKECKSDHEDLSHARQEEAAGRKEIILGGTSSDEFLVGMTVFYSFPTPVDNAFRYSNVQGVEQLYSPILDLVVKKETERILSYPFAVGAKLVFVQKSSREYFEKESGLPTIYWPVRGAGASGENLAELLKQP